jgi:hypothetical protein
LKGEDRGGGACKNKFSNKKMDLLLLEGEAIKYNKK